MEFTLSICTVFGGVSAVWFFAERIANFLNARSTARRTEKFPEIVRNSARSRLRTLRTFSVAVGGGLLVWAIAANLFTELSLPQKAGIGVACVATVLLGAWCAVDAFKDDQLQAFVCLLFVSWLASGVTSVACLNGMRATSVPEALFALSFFGPIMFGAVVTRQLSLAD